MIIDRNGLQITGQTEDVNPIEPLDEKLKSFGFPEFAQLMEMIHLKYLIL